MMASLAAQLSSCYKSGVVAGSLASRLRAMFPEALMLRWGSVLQIRASGPHY